MTVDSVRTSAGTPAFLPLQRPASSDFGAALRARIRAEAAQAIGDGLSGAAERAAVARYTTMQRSHFTPQTFTGDAAAWFDRARAVGGQYLSPQNAEVFARQMALESGGFDPDVISGRKISSAGAEGIAQLMPSSYPNVDRRDPIASLNAAAATMRANLQQFGGDMRKALAAYNAGSGAVAAAVARFGSAWESGLPVETQRYLEEILG
jgi:soluble lytic murein transglycosylase-like protein